MHLEFREIDKLECNGMLKVLLHNNRSNLWKYSTYENRILFDPRVMYVRLSPKTIRVTRLTLTYESYNLHNI